VEFEIFFPKSESEVQPPIVKRFAATCPVCGYTTPYARVREQIRARRGGTRDARMIAVITLRPDGSRGFRLATEQDVAVARRAAEELARREREHQGPLPLVPDEPFPDWYSGVFNPGLWNIKTWGDLFTPRQALALSTFVRLVREAHQEVLRETGDAGFARAVATCLAVAVSDMARYNSATAFYSPTMGLRDCFFGSGLPMKPDFAESNPTRSSLVGCFSAPLEVLLHVLTREGVQGFRSGTVRQGSATAIPLPDQSVPYVVTDPPYYAAVPYSDLSDFCYVWLKRMVGEFHPDLFRWALTPKDEEIIAYYVQPPDREPKDEAFFERKMKEALAECKRVLQPDGVAVVLFAHKGTAGWEALLNALVRAGWTVTSSWPIETERRARMRAKNSAVLASSVFLVCRPRPENAGVGDWRRVLEEMNHKVAAWLPKLEKEGIHGADAIFACIGPALEVYSRYERVETAGGQAIPLGDVRTRTGETRTGETRTGRTRTGGTPVPLGYLSYVWEAVAREALKLIFPEADPAGFEEDARVTAMWLWTLRSRINGASGAGVTPAPLANEDMLEEEEAEGAGRGTGPRAPTGYALPYDDARLIIQALGAHEEPLRRPGGILEVKGNVARLVPVAERRRFLIGQAVGGALGALAPTIEMPRRRRREQPSLFEELATEPETEASLALGASTLDRLHQAMLLFADGRSEALRRFLVDEGVGREAQFWRLADALSRLYPMNSQEKRWVDGLLARKKSWEV